MYNIDELIESTNELRIDIDKCIDDIVRGRLNNDQDLEHRAITDMERLLVQTNQQLTCILDYLHEDKKVDPFGIKNVNFTIIDENDDRWEEFKRERLERGFDESELWNLDATIAKFIYPRLKAFADDIIGVPAGLTEQDWKEILMKMVKAFELLTDDEIGGWFDKDQERLIEDGLNEFIKYFNHLWN